MQDDDPVATALAGVTARLGQAGIGRELTNGNVEAELKLLLAAALHAGAQRYVCAMDKEFNRAPLDLVALKNGTPAFWIEAKSTLRSAGLQSICAVAIEALAQIQYYSDQLRQETWTEIKKCRGLADEINAFRRAMAPEHCPAYIVHFLTSAPAGDHGLPQFVTRKFPRQPAIDAQALQRLYGPQGGLGAILEQKQAKIQYRLRDIPGEQTKAAGEVRREARRIGSAIRAFGRVEASCVRNVLQYPATDAVVVRFEREANATAPSSPSSGNVCLLS